MEQRLFIMACIMYAFSWLSKRNFCKKWRKTPVCFGAWHALFVFVILGCMYSLFHFIAASSAPALTQDSFLKSAFPWLIIAALAIYGFFSAKKKTDEKKETLVKKDLDWANTVYFAGFVASIVMFFFIQAFKIPSASMRNTLLEGDHLFVNKAAYGFRIPLTQIRFGQFKPIQPGDIIVFSFPAESPTQVNCGGLQYGRDYVKRVIAMPGDKVEIKNATLYINDKEQPLQGYEIFEPVTRYQAEEVPEPEVYQFLWEKRVLEHELGLTLRDNFGPVVVPEGSYFAMGDNRDNSCDSRFWGPVPRENIKGTAWFIHWPLNRIRLIK